MEVQSPRSVRKSSSSSFVPVNSRFDGAVGHVATSSSALAQPSDELSNPKYFRPLVVDMVRKAGATEAVNKNLSNLFKGNKPSLVPRIVVENESAFERGGISKGHPGERSKENNNDEDDNNLDEEDIEIQAITDKMMDSSISEYPESEARLSGSSCIPQFSIATGIQSHSSGGGACHMSLMNLEEVDEGRRRTTGVSSCRSDPLLFTSSQEEVTQVLTFDQLSTVNYTSFNNTGNNNNISPTRLMASPHPKSPGRPVTPKKDDKDETFWDKIGTLGRKKRIKEVQSFEQEGKNAIDSPGSPTQFDISPDEYDLAEGDERSLIERRSYADPKLQHLIGLLIDWINDELADQRIIVKSIEDDLYDGQILQKLLEKLTGHKLEVPEVSQSEEGQRHKLSVVLNAATQVLGLPRWSQQKWSVESIHSKNLVSILYLLVNLVRHFRAPLRLPENVNVETVVVKKRNGKLEYRRVTEEITSTYDEFGMRCERDAFDALLDHAPDKLQVVKKSLITFVNKHLNKINLEVTDIENQFHDGVYLVLLMGLLEGYFVPLFEFHLTPKDFEQKVFNVSFSFELMQDAGISKPKARPEDIVNVDLKSTLRVLYNLFAKYKNVN